MTSSREGNGFEDAEFLQLVGLLFFEDLAAGCSVNPFLWEFQFFHHGLSVRHVG